MVWSARLHQKWMLCAVVPSRSRPRIGHELAVAQAKQRSRVLISPIPAAKADHLIVFLPFGKCVVGCMNHYQTAALLYEIHQRVLHFFGPKLAIVIRDDHLVSREVRFELAHVLSSAR